MGLYVVGLSPIESDRAEYDPRIFGYDTAQGLAPVKEVAAYQPPTESYD